jgi:DNA-binding transcriptional LysR family regulator
MDARQLKFFLAVIDYGGFSRAAEQLFIAQPSLSQAIAGLERELGVPLFHRVGRGVVPSDAAERLIGPARQVMRDLATAQSAIDAVKGITTGQVEIISMPSPAVEPLTTIMTGFTRAHPDITLSVAAAFEPDDVLRAVRTGEVEIGLLGAPSPIKSADLRVLPIEDQELVLITKPNGSLNGADTITPDDLAGHGLIVAPKGSLMRALVDDILSSGVKAKVVAEVAHRTSILPMVVAGIADAILPAGWSKLALSAGAKVIRIQPPSHLHIVMVTRTTPLTPAAAAFVRATEGYTDTAQREQTTIDTLPRPAPGHRT